MPNSNKPWTVARVLAIAIAICALGTLSALATSGTFSEPRDRDRAPEAGAAAGGTVAKSRRCRIVRVREGRRLVRRAVCCTTTLTRSRGSGQNRVRTVRCCTIAPRQAGRRDARARTRRCRTTSTPAPDPAPTRPEADPAPPSPAPPAPPADPDPPASPITITDDDAATALIAVSNAAPGDSIERCIRVSYAGAPGGAVRLFATGAGGGLGPYLDVTISPGERPSGVAPDCAGFVAGGSPIFAGTLSQLLASHGDFAGGLATAPVSGAWVDHGSAVYRLTFALRDDPAANGGLASGPFTFTWEARGG